MVTEKLAWLDNWSWSSFQDTEEYGILYFYPSGQWAVYTKDTCLVVAVTEGWYLGSLLGMETGDTEFWRELGTKHTNVEIAA